MAAALDSDGQARNDGSAEDRLDSWKEIASYLRRSDRTVRRWEHELNLPVHRLSDQKRASVYALKSELDAWWKQSGDSAKEDPKSIRRAGWPRSRWIRVAAALASAAILVSVALVGARSGRRGPIGWKQLTFDTGSTSYPAISKDGTLIAYASDRSGRGDYDIYVQSLARGSATRLTTDEERDYAPDISPDGSRIAFHSYRDGSGIYMVPVAGGAQTRIADGGDNPRFSPDGAWLAYDLELPDRSYAIHVIPSSGGPARRITTPLFWHARAPLWTPDGKALLFVGSTRRKPDEFDWWVAPLAGGDAIQTGVSAALQKQQLLNIRFFQPPLDWIGNDVVFSYPEAGRRCLRRIPLRPPTWQAGGRAEQLTFGAGREIIVRVAASSRHRSAVVAAGEQQTHLWAFDFEPETAAMAQHGRQLTHDLSMLPSMLATRPSVSSDGAMLVFASRRTSNYDLWIQDLRTGAERVLVGGPLNETDSLVAPDGSAVAFARSDGIRWPILISSIDGSGIRQVCDDCGRPSSWSADARWLLYTTTDERLGALNLNTGVRVLLNAAVPVISGSFAPDGRTVAAGVRAGNGDRLVLLAFDNGVWASEQNWILLADLEASAAVWSPSGGTVYFLSLADQYRCLWAQRISKDGRRPVGGAFPIRHFHSVQLYPQMSRWFAVTRDRIFLRLTAEHVNLWSADFN